MAETIRGAVERITYYNEDNGYSVIKIMPEERHPRAQARDGTVAVVGTMPELREGESAEFTGEWVNDSRWGYQFRADQTLPRAPQSRLGIVSYLSSGIVKGIGPKTAERIVDHFGENTIEILDAEPERIHEVSALTHTLAKNLVQIWSKNRVMRNTIIYLQGLGISAKIAKRIWDEYQEQTQRVIENNPYQLAQDVFLIGFRKADQIARNMGLAPDDPHRLRAGLHYALNEMASDGHTFSPREQLLEKAAELLGVGDQSALAVALEGQIAAKKLVGDKLRAQAAADTIDAVYLPRFHRAENESSRLLRTLVASSSLIIRDQKERNWSRYLAQLSASHNVTLSPQQQSAVQAALTSKVSVLTGGPGTGKTTTLRLLIESLLEADYQFRLASPTGRAAKRLAEATGVEASTIHRLLGFSPDDYGFEHDESNRLPVDMVVVDEASMLDLQLFYSLLRALQPTSHLLLVGDVDQLPSVGAGNVLRDVIDSGIAHVTRLNQIFRQDDSSQIVSNAHRINQGQHPVTDNQATDFYFFNIADPDAVAAEIVKIVKTKVPERWGFDPMTDIQVIAPMYRGGAGVNNLNERLQRELNGDPRQAEIKLGTRLFRVGDKVMQTRNNYDKEVFNGDIGFIDSIDHSDNSLDVAMDGADVVYDFSELSEMMHAFCISTHRSQGSEYPVVVMPVLTQHYMLLQRNLIYTAITRAKQLVILVGTRRALHIAVNNNQVAERHSGLLARLQA